MEAPEEQAFVETFRATLPELYAHVARHCGGERELSEDVVQETWLRAVQEWRRRGLPREPLAWLRTTASNLLKNHFRALGRERARRDALAHEQRAHGVSDSRTVDVAENVQAALGELGTQEAALVEDFHLAGHSTRELAQRHGLSERAVEGRLRRARARLKHLLQRRRA